MILYLLQASLYGQIVKWFQNHSYLDRKLCGDVNAKKPPSTCSESTVEIPESDDEETVALHLNELKREVKNNRPDDNRLARLMSLTYTSRHSTMASTQANARLSLGINEYPCLKKPIFVSLLIFVYSLSVFFVLMHATVIALCISDDASIMKFAGVIGVLF